MNRRASSSVRSYVLADSAITRLQKLIELKRDPQNFPDRTPRIRDSLLGLGRCLLRQQAFADAEPVLREALELAKESAPDNWRTAATKSMLGESLAGQEKFEQAEPMLLDSHDKLVQGRATMPPWEQPRQVSQAVRRLVEMYTAWGKTEDADKWTGELENAVD